MRKLERAKSDGKISSIARKLGRLWRKRIQFHTSCCNRLRRESRGIYLSVDISTVILLSTPTFEASSLCQIFSPRALGHFTGCQVHGKLQQEGKTSSPSNSSSSIGCLSAFRNVKVTTFSEFRPGIERGLVLLLFLLRVSGACYMPCVSCVCVSASARKKFPIV